MLAVAYSIAGCGPRRDPNAPDFPVPPPPPETAAPATLSSRSMPAPVLGRFEQPTVAASPARAIITTESPPARAQPDPDQAATAREPPQAHPAETTDALPDEVVVRLLEGARAAFIRCFKNAIAEDPTQVSFKVLLHVELDDNGAITATRTDSDRPALDKCLVRMTALLRFPASGKPINVDVPLFYQGN